MYLWHYFCARSVAVIVVNRPRQLCFASTMDVEGLIIDAFYIVFERELSMTLVYFENISKLWLGRTDTIDLFLITSECI